MFDNHLVLSGGLVGPRAIFVHPLCCEMRHHRHLNKKISAVRFLKAYSDKPHKTQWTSLLW